MIDEEELSCNNQILIIRVKTLIFIL